MDSEENLGPCMSALNERQRAFVRALIERPKCTFMLAARLAGFGVPGSSSHVLRQIGYRLAHQENIISAIQEEARRGILSQGTLVGFRVLLQIAQNDGHKDQLRAAEMLLNRVGFHEITEHKVMVTKTDMTGAAMVERIKLLAAGLGFDPALLLGGNAPEVAMKVIEHVPAGKSDG